MSAAVDFSTFMTPAVAVMTYCYTNRSVHLSALFREASCCSKWQLTGGTTTGNCVERIRDWEVLSHKEINKTRLGRLERKMGTEGRDGERE